MKFIKHKIKEWNIQYFGDIFKDKKALKNQMEQIQQSIISRGSTTQLKENECTLKYQLMLPSIAIRMLQLLRLPT